MLECQNIHYLAKNCNQADIIIHKEIKGETFTSQISPKLSSARVSRLSRHVTNDVSVTSLVTAVDTGVD